MYRVLLVDDEPLVHQHVWSLGDWQSNGFELSGEAYNGEMALQLIERTRPHIAIIDVNMQGMNGVELQRAIRLQYPHVRTIMLSSYDDYDYVRECLKNGAVDYLLKHRLDEQMLMTVLHKAALEVQPSSGPGTRGIAQAPEGSSYLLRLRESLSDLMQGKEGAIQALEHYTREIGVFTDTVSYVTAAVQIVSFRLLTESRSDVQTNRLVQQVVDLMQQSLGDPPDRMAAYVENGRLAAVFAFRDRSEQAAASEAARLMSKLRHSLELFLNLKCTYAIGHVCGHLRNIEASYRSAERLLDAGSPSEKPWRGSERISLTIEEHKRLLLAIENLDKERAQQLLASIFSSIRGQPVHSQPVQMMVSELLSIGEKALEKGLLHDEDMSAGSMPVREALGRIDSMDELEQWLQSYYEALLQRLGRQRAGGPYSSHVSQAILLILEQYPSYITLELAAKAIGLSPSYLSRIFKEETKSTFSEYVNRVRIEASRKLLESGQYSVKQISSQVGFGTYNYFFKVFKEMTGMTPHAYVNRIGRK
ncbi:MULTISPECIES: helix-turn-helix domain-containing protein [Paenibacillus]|uniref:Helix-turn-helix domain-containing protein n=1 Tax=Paenibacillus campinasensis TaxID=66347 RepID=A0ABW9SZF2_9BACL|nr:MULTISPECIES: helix-turn-helix domain-containing protein [Paenibacillus]MUG66369.1 helix-turn-helix domain-containing protein [Paenibacillus campinasensis]PAK54433.1 DNA-binding response regulator [Paenibacillus sp. 7541]